MKPDVAARKIERLKDKVRVLETMIENKTRDLYVASRQLEEAKEFLSDLTTTMPGALIATDPSGLITQINLAACTLMGREAEDVLGHPVETLFATEVPVLADQRIQLETAIKTKSGTTIPVWVAAGPIRGHNELRGYALIAQDIRERKSLELELRQTQKLDSIGQLAAGVAHEINTPLQFISDNVHFLRESATEMLGLVELYRALSTTDCEEGRKRLIARISDEEETIDIEFVVARTPKAFTRTAEGIARVVEIVGAMRQLSHPGTAAKAPADLGRAIKNALAIARHEYRELATIDLKLADLPKVECSIGDITQVILNLIVNAAHAIGALDKSRAGVIELKTRAQGEFAVIEVTDNGCGFTPDLAQRIFDPFFTTKEVGKGTGQGLSISRSIVETRHDGRLAWASVPGSGSTFEIWLPFHAQPKETKQNKNREAA